MAKRINCTPEDVEKIVSILEFWGEYNVKRDDPVILEDDGFIRWITIAIASYPLQDIISEGFCFSISASTTKSGFINIFFSRWE